MSEDSKSHLCRYFLVGQCTRGRNCPFSHNPKSKKTTICRFFQNGNCMFQESCKNMHMTVQGPNKQRNTDSAAKSAIRILRNVGTPSAAYDKFGPITTEHREPDLGAVRSCVYCGTKFPADTKYSAFKDHMLQCETTEFETRQVEKFQQSSYSHVCSICMEHVLLKDKAVDCNFGLLENCDHVFCLHCIRDWRKVKDVPSSTARACPICRVVSHFIIPSYFFPPNKEEKDKIIEKYKFALSQKHCVYFNRGKSLCPFSSSCFFRHEFPDGTLANRVRLLMSADGTLNTYSPYRESDGAFDDVYEALRIRKDPT